MTVSINRTAGNGMQDDPAKEIYTVEIVRNSRGIAIHENWKVNRKQHRVDGPAKIERHAETGAVVAEYWFRQGEFHREDGPAIIKYDAETGRVKRSRWFRNDEKVTAPRRPPKRPGRKSSPPSEPSA